MVFPGDVPQKHRQNVSVSKEKRSPSSSRSLPRSSSSPRVWAIGGGKGGVGKSVITANMAVSLASRGKRCVLIDADLGGANLHTLIGMSSPRHTLSEFFRRDGASLKDIVLPTAYENLFLISGARALLDMANPAHAQKMKFIRQLSTLDLDHIFIDLGAGSSFTVMDFFLAARDQVMVVAPTPTSVENAYHFLRAVFYRNLRQAIQKAGVRHLVDQVLEEKVKRGVRSPRDLMRYIAEACPQSAPQLADGMKVFAPRLVINQARRPEDRALGDRMATACRDFFGADVRCGGHIQNDDRVLQAIQARRPALEMFPDSPFALSLHSTITRLLGQQEVASWTHDS